LIDYVRLLFVFVGGLSLSLSLVLGLGLGLPGGHSRFNGVVVVGRRRRSTRRLLLLRAAAAAMMAMGGHHHTTRRGGGRRPAFGWWFGWCCLPVNDDSQNESRNKGSFLGAFLLLGTLDSVGRLGGATGLHSDKYVCHNQR
jgi:hypothetical protein